MRLYVPERKIPIFVWLVSWSSWCGAVRQPVGCQLANAGCATTPLRERSQFVKVLQRDAYHCHYTLLITTTLGKGGLRHYVLGVRSGG